MPIPLLLSAGIAAAPSLAKGVAGLIGIGKGNRMARENVRPVENVNANIAKNAAMAEQMAQVGLPQQQYNLAQQNLNRNLTSGIRTLGRSANPSAGVAGLLRASNDAALNLSAQDSQARMQNQRFAFGQRSQLANEENRVWDWNKRQNYLAKAKAASETLNAGRKNAFGALSDLSTLGQSLAGQASGAGDMSNQLGGLTQSAQPNIGSTYNKFNSSNRLF